MHEPNEVIKVLKEFVELDIPVSIPNFKPSTKVISEKERNGP